MVNAWEETTPRHCDVADNALTKITDAVVENLSTQQKLERFYLSVNVLSELGVKFGHSIVELVLLTKLQI